MLQLLDIFLTLVHLLIIGFNLFAWLVPSLRKAHLINVGITAGSWLVLGLWKGIGYCPVTDWQWQVKEKLGEGPLPASFITYMAEKITGKAFTDAFINSVTGISFTVVALISIYLNFFKKHNRKKR